MFNLTASMRYYLYSYPTDLRKSFYTLSGIVCDRMRRNVQDGEVFIFINRSCTSMKVLHMECGGLVIYHLKLESGTFHLPFMEENIASFPTNWQELMMMVRGLGETKDVREKRWKKSSKQVAFIG
jgi:IS66 Orf2 like protein.